MTDLREQYERRHKTVLEPAAKRLTTMLTEYVSIAPALPHIDRVGARAKGVSRFLDKSKKREEDGRLKYEDPLGEIQDQIGARVIVFYLDDVPKARERIEQYFRPSEMVAKEPQSNSEFDYFGFHYVLMLPDDVVPDGAEPADVPSFFELQIKTLFQHAWSEGGHDMAYKPPRPLTPDEKRLLAFASASAWGADRSMQELYNRVVLDKAQ